MPRRSNSKPRRVADVTFLQVRIQQSHERQKWRECDERLSLVSAGADQIPLVSRRNEAVCASKEAVKAFAGDGKAVIQVSDRDEDFVMEKSQVNR